MLKFFVIQPQSVLLLCGKSYETFVTSKFHAIYRERSAGNFACHQYEVSNSSCSTLMEHGQGEKCVVPTLGEVLNSDLHGSWCVKALKVNKPVPRSRTNTRYVRKKRSVTVYLRQSLGAHS